MVLLLCCNYHIFLAVHMLSSIYKGQHACQRLKSTLAASSALVGASPPASSSLPAPIFSRWQVLRSFSGTDLAAGKAFEAAGLSPGNENNTVSRRRCPEKPYCPLYTEGNAQNAELLYQTAAKNTREIQNLPLCAHKTSCAARAPRKKQKLLRGKLLYSMFGRPEGAGKWHIA